MSKSSTPKWAPTPLTLTLDPRVTDSAKVLWGLLHHHAYRYSRGKPWPTQAQIARELGKTERPVSRAIECLEQSGWVTVHRRGKSERWERIEVHDECMAPGAPAVEPYPSERSRYRSKSTGSCESISTGSEAAEPVDIDPVWWPENVDLPAETGPAPSIYTVAERSEDTVLSTTSYSAANRAMDNNDVVIDTGREPANDVIDTGSVLAAGIDAPAREDSPPAPEMSHSPAPARGTREHAERALLCLALTGAEGLEPDAINEFSTSIRRAVYAAALAARKSGIGNGLIPAAVADRLRELGVEYEKVKPVVRDAWTVLGDADAELIDEYAETVRSYAKPAAA